MVFGIISTWNAHRQGNSTQLCIVLFHPLPEFITRAVNPEYHSNPCCYLYIYDSYIPCRMCKSSSVLHYGCIDYTSR